MDRQQEQQIITGRTGSRSVIEAMGHLHRLSSLIASDRLSEALSTAIEIPVQYLGIGATALLLPSHDPEQLRLTSARNLTVGLREGILSSGSDALVGWVVRNSAPRVVDDFSALPSGVSSTYLRHGMRSAVCVPVETGGPRAGAMLYLSPLSGAYTVWEVEFLSMLANQISAVLRRQETAEIGFEYVKLFEQSKLQTSHLRSLYKVARTITSSLELDDVVQEILRYLRKHLSADVCTLLTYDRAYDEIRLAGGYSAIGGNDEQYMELTRPAIVAALRSRRPVEYQDLLSAPEYADMEEVRRLGLRSGVVAALSVQGRITGFIAAFRRQSHGFPRQVVRVLPGLAELAAIAMENARLYQRQSDIAHMTQRSLIPMSLQEIPGFDVGYKYAPAYQVGGDYCDIIGLPNGHFGIAIADVAGKDITAASHIGMCRHSLRAVADEIRSPATLIRKMNRLVCEQTEPEAFISMIYAVLNPITRKLSLSSAGHEPALLYRAGSGKIEELSTHGLLLGIQPRETYSLRSTSIQVGDILALYTDGLVDALTTRESPGIERLYELLAGTCHQTAQQIADAFYDQAQGDSHRSPDDVALILLKAL